MVHVTDRPDPSRPGLLVVVELGDLLRLELVATDGGVIGVWRATEKGRALLVEVPAAA